ncbi:MAG: hypothetical protein VCC00_01595 [Deltaproteobacteria bacterium]
MKGRARLRRILFVCIAALYVLSVPWYRSSSAPVEIVFGLPDWVAVAIGCYVLVALLNSAAWLLQDAPQDMGEAGREASGKSA